MIEENNNSNHSKTISCNILDPKNKAQMKFINFSNKQSKEFNLRLFDYYQNYLKDIHKDSTICNSKTKTLSHFSSISINDKFEEK